MISFSLVTRHFGACHALPRFLGVRRTSLRRESARHGPRRPASRRGIRLDGQRLGVFAASPRRRGRPGNDDDDWRSFSLRRTARRVSNAFFGTSWAALFDFSIEIVDFFFSAVYCCSGCLLAGPKVFNFRLATKEKRPLRCLDKEATACLSCSILSPIYGSCYPVLLIFILQIMLNLQYQWVGHDNPSLPLVVIGFI